MEKNMEKNAYICITELLCSALEIKHAIVNQLYVNDI